MNGICYEVDYVSEREAFAIRTNAFAFRRICYSAHDHSWVLDEGEHQVRVPDHIVQQFMEDWRRCGAWSLHGTREPNELPFQTARPASARVTSLANDDD